VTGHTALRAGPVDARPSALAAVAAGGVVGAEARLGVEQLVPHAAQGFPWSTLIVNVSGCLAVGAVIAVLVARSSHPLARPFLVVGVLGGYTTFSGYTVDAVRLVDAERGAFAVAYLGGTLLLALAAALAGAALARAGLERIYRSAPDDEGGWT